MGIYVHIPFCRSKCYYCGFYSVASTQLKKAYIAALGHEIQLRKDYLGTSEVKTELDFYEQDQFPKSLVKM